MSNCPIFLRVLNNTNSKRALFCKDKHEAMKLFYLFGATNSVGNFEAVWEYIGNGKTSKLIDTLGRKLNKQKWRTIEDVTCCIVNFKSDSAYIVDADYEVDVDRSLVALRKTASIIHPPPPQTQTITHGSLVQFLPGFFLADRLI